MGGCDYFPMPVLVMCFHFTAILASARRSMEFKRVVLIGWEVVWEVSGKDGRV